MVISEKKSNLQIVIPEGYKIYKGKKPKTASQYGGKDAGWYVKRTPNALCVIVGWKISVEDAMDFDNPQNLIDGIHRSMSEKQGLIEVESGMTVRGYRYIYSIVKTVNDFQSTDYFLRMHVADGDDIIELHCEFSEDGMTGTRDSMGMELARRAKLIDGDYVEDMFKGWNEDPYDPAYTKGIPMNLSERHGVDGMFPNHPLSQAREFVHAIITDEIILAREDDEEKEKSEERAPDSDSKSKDMSEEEMLKKLFDKDTVRNYHAQKVTVPDASVEKRMSSDDIKETLKKGAQVAGGGLKKGTVVASKGIKVGAEVTGKGIKAGAAATGKGLKIAAETIQEKGKEVKEKRQEKKSQELKEVKDVDKEDVQDTYVKKKKEMIFQSVESLQQVVNAVNEAAYALNDKSRTMRESAMSEVLMGALGAGLGGAGSYAALYGLGSVGLSAAGISSGLAAAGSVVGGGMVAGIFVLAVPVAALAAGGVGVAAHLKNKQLRQEKERLYTEALKKHDAIIKALKDEVDADKERLDYLQSLNILLTQAIKDLKKDLGIV